MTRFHLFASLKSLAAAAVIAVSAVSVGLSGCGGGVKEETIVVPKVSAVDEAKQIVQNYANGAPVTSEAAGFPDLIARVKAEDAAKGEALEKGLAQIQAQPNNRASLAKGLLTKL